MSHDTKDTSIAAYHSTPSLEDRVIASIQSYGPLTRQQLATAVAKPINSICAPVKALLKAGLLYETHKVKNLETGKENWALSLKVEV